MDICDLELGNIFLIFQFLELGNMNALVDQQLFLLKLEHQQFHKKFHKKMLKISILHMNLKIPILNCYHTSQVNSLWPSDAIYLDQHWFR